MDLEYYSTKFLSIYGTTSEKTLAADAERDADAHLDICTMSSQSLLEPPPKVIVPVNSACPAVYILHTFHNVVAINAAARATNNATNPVILRPAAPLMPIHGLLHPVL